ncbi:hypothetical protein [Winogradskyella sp. A3E31]|uniref:hypothetical protein n=1 Tax=Winogradskyella sp. A3E31 TaxID=3349637 RepID=UPI00398AC976
MKDKTGLIIAIIGIVILGGIIGYQAKTGESLTYLIPVGLGINLFGVFLHMKRNRK